MDTERTVEAELVDGKRELFSFDDKPIEERIRDFGNVIERAQARGEFHYFLWMMGKTLASIREITGYNRSTIWEDIGKVRQRLPAKDLTTIRDETLMMLRIDRSKAMDFIDSDKVDDRTKSKFLEVVMKIDLDILERYTQPIRGPAQEMQQEYEEKMKAVLDYMIEKMGADSISDFATWWAARKARQGMEPKKIVGIYTVQG